jgi:thioredoxin
MEVLTIDTFKEKIFDFSEHKQWTFKGEKPTVIDFYADWCGPCHQLTPILEDTAEIFKDQVNFYKVNTEASPELAALFEVRSIPALLFIPFGEEPAMAAGVIPREKLEQAIREIFNLNK